MMQVKDFCESQYEILFQLNYELLKLKSSKRKIKNIDKLDEEIKIQARKHAIQETVREALLQFPNIEPAEIWKYIYVAHVNHRSGETDSEKIKQIIAADQSWKKSSGHAFESMIKDMANPHLARYSLKIFLQKDITVLLKERKIVNDPEDITIIQGLTKTDIFDLFIGINLDSDTYKIFGVIQSKTSIRERVSKDREPSQKAMANFFLSIAIVLDGDFLKLPKFKSMVNGTTTEYDINGWHAMYVFSNNKTYEADRIFTFDSKMATFITHMISASQFWIKSRQRFNHSWRPPLTEPLI
ncbi:BsaWI family type II restriction enzyme [Mucilaginibacter gilvus]|uniref:BsaWI restriction endonuclease type 2 domain-containing protein n=1 Tax=Mucilaginibacter gilvus TaxID=2305909 RepID=A0A444MT93_9SPHI|nr:BsaWI family type II restriction enzyme [Mucilaginibacter gilvus]RWY55842.1 hypothetical protein EPL05_05585 [Mucilaginibacter gilvus]